MSRRPNFGKVAGRPLDADIVDADFETISPVNCNEPQSPKDYVVPSISTADAPMLGGMDMLRRLTDRVDGEPERGSPVFWLASVVLIAGAFWVSGGHSVIRPMFSAPASTETDRMRIASVISRVDRAGARPVLQVDGNAVNDGAAATAMPPLAIHVSTNAGDTTIYNLGTGGGAVESGGSFAFSSRLDMPKDGVKTVFVTFAE